MCYEVRRLTRRTPTRQLQDTQIPKITSEETSVRSRGGEAESAFGHWLHNVVRSVKPEKHSAKPKEGEEA